MSSAMTRTGAPRSRHAQESRRSLSPRRYTVSPQRIPQHPRRSKRATLHGRRLRCCSLEQLRDKLGNEG